MSRNPFEPPGSKVSEKRASQRYQFLWKGYFIFSLYVAIATSVYVPTMRQLSYMDVLDFGVTLVSVLGIYGFTYAVRLYNVVFWRYFFYLALFEAIAFCFFLPLLGVPRYGREFYFDAFYLLELGYVVLRLYALNLYAYKRPQLWKKKGESR
ncbi:hypothetical protein ACXYTJ_02350 [Gilvimarinus sp. F26214L]|uniref:hypothetical protein n=1 Tax=Gilvimarinus sp. DZF01 TaxID=3461371 RepID=UPI0040452691